MPSCHSRQRETQIVPFLVSDFRKWSQVFAVVVVNGLAS